MLSVLANQHDTSTTGWVIGYSVTIAVVVVVVALVVPILLQARKIGDQAGEIDDLLGEAVHNTAGLSGLRTTVESADAIVSGLERGRARLGG